ncbi:MAG: hydroxymethylglutaryl-CoA synthase [Candidatus Aenigmarchaeota archaeon]|nr:hydroxymethylglutaryl-CoA synthase [Candidatus Aenigmarchaeota archaeon]
MVGIVGYGSYVPRLRISVEEIAKVWGENPEGIKKGLNITEKSVPELDEDTITISLEAARNALLRAEINPRDIGAVYIGSESHPYAVKPSGTVVAEALGVGPDVNIVDTEFACKAGTSCIILNMGLVKAGYIKYGLAIGADTSQGRPGDMLEYTAAAGGAAFIIGNKDLVAEIEDWYSFTTDTSDFWRREGQDYPSHGARFTGKPAYFKHLLSSTNNIMEKNNLKPEDFKHVVLHMPNGKFPLKAAKTLGFSSDQIRQSMIVCKIGNCYSGSSVLGLTNVLDIAEPGDKILMTSYGSGAGSDSFIINVTDRILKVRDKAKKTEDYMNNKENINYGMYARLRGKLKV